jgi:23S rRNA (cytosine1962-C5)-methyltransferase
MDLHPEAGRIFHGRGGLHPGCSQWTLDAYPPVLVLTSFAPVDEASLAVLHSALAARWQQLAPDSALCWVFQHRGTGRASTRLMAGQVPDPHVVAEAGVRYQVHVQQGQNHGLFLDMAAGRRWLQAWAAGRPGLRMLNLFAYTCAFSVVARLAGVQQVVNVDMSAGALAIGQQNHRLNGITTGASFLPHDVFNSWGKLGRSGPYDLVVLDPPSHQKGSFVATKDYARLVRRLPALLAPGGHALLCLNAPELGPDFLLALLAQEAPGLQFVERLANPPAFADVSADRALKVLVVRAPD